MEVDLVNKSQLISNHSSLHNYTSRYNFEECQTEVQIYEMRRKLQFNFVGITCVYMHLRFNVYAVRASRPTFMTSRSHELYEPGNCQASVPNLSNLLFKIHYEDARISNKWKERGLCSFLLKSSP